LIQGLADSLDASSKCGSFLEAKVFRDSKLHITLDKNILGERAILRLNSITTMGGTADTVPFLPG
jgi:hypothetical protein